MGKRITVLLDDDLLRKLRILQATQIKESLKSVSLSRIVNDVLRKNWKKIE